MYKYKLVNIRQKSFFLGRKVKLEALEELINKFAAQGWELDRIFDANVSGMLGLGGKDVFILVLKRLLS